VAKFSWTFSLRLGDSAPWQFIGSHASHTS